MQRIHAAPSSSAAAAKKRQLKLVFVLSLIYFVVEVAGGLISHSLALLADAGHMLTDVGGLGLALLAIRFAERPATPEKTYGYYRVEILAALANAIVLIGISGFILFEAYQRFKNPPVVATNLMLPVAVLGLAVNGIGIYLLRKSSTESLNIKGAYLEVLSDTLSSLGVIAAALIMRTTGWYYADPIISAGIGVFILPRTWVLLREAIGVLLEGTPSDINISSVREAISKLPGVLGVHDLHVWTLTSGVNALSAHIVVADGYNSSEMLDTVQRRVTSGFRISHVTVQLEPPGSECRETHL